MIDVTDHAALRWLQRSDDWSLGVDDAWAEASAAEMEYLEGRVRYHAPSDTYLVAQGDAIATVLDANHVDRADSMEATA